MDDVAGQRVLALVADGSQRWQGIGCFSPPGGPKAFYMYIHQLKSGSASGRKDGMGARWNAGQWHWS